MTGKVMTEFDVDTAIIDAGCVVISARGEIDPLTAPRLADAVGGAVDASATRIVLDLAGVTFMDSAGIHVLIRAWEQVRDLDDRPLVLTNLQPQVRRVIDACGLFTILQEQ